MIPLRLTTLSQDVVDGIDQYLENRHRARLYETGDVALQQRLKSVGRRNYDCTHDASYGEIEPSALVRDYLFPFSERAVVGWSQIAWLAPGYRYSATVTSLDVRRVSAGENYVPTVHNVAALGTLLGSLVSLESLRIESEHFPSEIIEHLPLTITAIQCACHTEPDDIERIDARLPGLASLSFIGQPYYSHESLDTFDQFVWPPMMTSLTVINMAWSSLELADLCEALPVGLLVLDLSHCSISFRNGIGHLLPNLTSLSVKKSRLDTPFPPSLTSLSIEKLAWSTGGDSASSSLNIPRSVRHFRIGTDSTATSHPSFDDFTMDLLPQLDLQSAMELIRLPIHSRPAPSATVRTGGAFAIAPQHPTPSPLNVTGANVVLTGRTNVITGVCNSRCPKTEETERWKTYIFKLKRILSQKFIADGFPGINVEDVVSVIDDDFGGYPLLRSNELIELARSVLSRDELCYLRRGFANFVTVPRTEECQARMMDYVAYGLVGEKVCITVPQQVPLNPVGLSMIRTLDVRAELFSVFVESGVVMQSLQAITIHVRSDVMFELIVQLIIAARHLFPRLESLQTQASIDENPDLADELATTMRLFLRLRLPNETVFGYFVHPPSNKPEE